MIVPIVVALLMTQRDIDILGITFPPQNIDSQSESPHKEADEKCNARL